MTLDEMLLQKLAEWRPDSGRQTLTVAHPETGWTAAVDRRLRRPRRLPGVGAEPDPSRGRAGRPT